MAINALWRHPSPETTFLEHFRLFINKCRSLNLETYDDVYTYSVDQYPNFWEDVLLFSKIIYAGKYEEVVDRSAPIESIPVWFGGMKLNMAENMLFGDGKAPSKIAVTCIREGNTEIRDISWGKLRELVGEMTSAMRAAGIKKGDRVAVVASNSLNTLLVFMSVASLGAIFTATSTDMGTKGILDRLLQIRPSLVFMDDFAVYGGKETNLKTKAAEVVVALQGFSEFQGLVSLPRHQDAVDVSEIHYCQTLQQFLSRATSKTPQFERLHFNTPYLIAYSSGTTGPPKCIVHGVGGYIISQKKELLLHYNIGPESTQLVFTTTSWAMYNKSVTALLNGAHVITYDGSPFYPDATVLISICEQQRVTHLGISPRYLNELQSRNIHPREIADVTSLQLVNSTGAALLSQQYDWFYEKAFHPHTQLGNSAGGTETASSYAVQNTLLPVYAGELQRRALGMKLEIYEQLEDGTGIVEGKLVAPGNSGELVIETPFPTMPVMFWGEGGMERYRSSYFSTFKGVWTQGDFGRFIPETGGLEITGRSDGVLNPSGVRFGSAEIYRVTQQFSEIADAICVGQRRPQDTDEVVFLFVLMKAGFQFDSDITERIRQAVRVSLSPRHVPQYIFECFAIPVTINQKKVELPVKKIISGEKVIPSSTLVNPESLSFFYRFAEIEKLVSKTRAGKLLPAKL